MRRTCCGCGVFLGWTWPNSIASRGHATEAIEAARQALELFEQKQRTPSQGVLEHSSPNSEQTPDLPTEALHRLEAARPTISLVRPSVTRLLTLAALAWPGEWCSVLARSWTAAGLRAEPRPLPLSPLCTRFGPRDTNQQLKARLSSCVFCGA